MAMAATNASKPDHSPMPPVREGPVPHAAMVPPPPALRRTIGGISGLAGLVALAGIGLGFAELAFGQPGPGPFWMTLFQVCALVACVMGVLGGAGRFSSGPAMTPLIVSGVLLMAGALSEPSLIRSGIPRLEVMGLPLRPLALAELVFALLLGGLSVLVVLVRRPGKTIPKAVIGVVLVAPAFLLAVGLLMPSVRAQMSGWSPVVLTMVVVGVLAVAGVLLSVGSQFVIRALEIGIEAGFQNEDSSESAA
jgi:hypothetical protein